MRALLAAAGVNEDELKIAARRPDDIPFSVSRPSSPAPVTGEAASGRLSMNVLLLCSETKPRAELESWLREAGCSVRLDAPACEPDWQPGAVVVWLPRLLEAALARRQELRSLPAAASAWLLGVGGWREFPDISRLLESGFDDYLPWPADAFTLRLRLLTMEKSRIRQPLNQDQRRLESRVVHAQKTETLAAIAGGLAHDFNNLLSAILGNAELALLDLDPDSPLRHNLEQIERTSRRAGDLARQMLTFSRRPAGAFSSVDLNDLVREMAELLGTPLRNRCRLDLQLAPQLPPVRGEATQLRQVAMNLLINAAEATDTGSGVVTVRTSEVEWPGGPLANAAAGVSLCGGRYVRLEVRDAGHGMDGETRRRIFDPFFSTKKQGRGLGLAAVLSIVRDHFGEVQVESQPGSGTAFRVFIPAANQEPETAGDGGAAGDDWRGEGTILLVDDEEAVREAAGRLLERAGYTVLAVATGEQALEVFGDFSSEISAVVLDVSLPGIDGLEVLREIRARRPEMRVFLWSGFGAEQLSEALAENGLVQFIPKPSCLRDLALALKQAFAPA